MPIAGDVVQPFCGIEPAIRDDLRGEVDAVVNASGVVDFDPPLDEALEVNAFGVQNLVALAHDLGKLPFLHTSTSFVAGCRTGFIEEQDPREHPFPRAGELDHVHWDPDREIAECLDVIEQARHRANDAFRQSGFLDEAKKHLRERNEPARGATLEAEIEQVKRSSSRPSSPSSAWSAPQFWGFPNTYTYTKAIGEQIAANSGLPFTIVRPAIVESSVEFPCPGWNEGINTSAPLIYIMREGGLQFPGSENYLDFIPCDMVAGGMILSLGGAARGTRAAVYQLRLERLEPLHDAALLRAHRALQAQVLPEHRHGRAGRRLPAVALRGRAADQASSSSATGRKAIAEALRSVCPSS